MEKFDTRPPPSLSINFFTSEKFLKHSTEGFLSETLRYCEKEQVRQKIVITARSLIPYNIRYQKFSDTQTTKLFGTVRKKIRRKRLILHPPFYPQTFCQRTETKHRRVPLRIVVVLSDKTNLTENRDGCLLSYTQHVSIPEIGETLKDSSQKFLALIWKISTENIIRNPPPPSYP